MCDFYDGKKHVFFDLRNEKEQEKCAMFMLDSEYDVMIAHNLEYDLANVFKNVFLGIIDELVYASRLITAKIGDLVLMDSYNWCQMPLKNMAKLVGMEKGDLEVSKENWNEFVEYNKVDTEILYKFCDEFQSDLNRERLNLRPTIARLAMDMYRTRFLKRKVPQNSCVKALESYYGGRTEAFFIGDLEGDIRVCDVRAMYPTVMKFNQYPFGFCRECDFNRTEYGFGKFMVSVPKDIPVPILPVHRDGKLMFPTGEFRGWWTFPELRYAIANGVQLKWIEEAYGTEEGISPFGEYMDYNYNLRQKAREAKNEFKVMMHKLYMNSLYGKYGQHKKGVVLKSSVTADDLEKYNVKGSCGEFKILEAKEDDVSPSSNYIWAAYVTSYARIILHKAFMKVLEAGHRIIYCDTDSIFYVHNGKHNGESPLPISTTMGEFEEFRFAKAEISTLKAYKLTDSNGKEKLACKGVPQKYMGEFLEKGLVEILKPMRLREGLNREMDLNVWGTVEKKMQSIYDKRTINADGSTVPLHLELAKEGI
jgi:hypothetical protein